MKVLYGVPSTMHNFVTEAFGTLYMGPDCFLGQAEPDPEDPALYRKHFWTDGWNSQGAYEFGATFEGDATDHYWNHKIEAHLHISGLYDDVWIEWESGHGGLDYGYELPYYWPKATRELEKFSFEVYRGSPESLQAQMCLREFVDDLTM